MIIKCILETSYSYLHIRKEYKSNKYIRWDGATEVFYDGAYNRQEQIRYYVADMIEARPIHSCNKIMQYLIDENAKSKYKVDII